MTGKTVSLRTGLLGPEEAPLGAWLAEDVRDDGAPSHVKVLACWRTEDGRAVGAYLDGVVDHRGIAALAEAAYREGEGALVPARGRIPQAFGLVVSRMREAVDERALDGRSPGDGWERAKCAGTLLGFLGTLDGDAVSWATERGLLDRVGAAWHMVDATFGRGAPLRTSVDAWPWSRRLALELWEAHPEAAATMGPADVHAWITDRLTGPPHRYPRHVARRHADVARAATALAEVGRGLGARDGNPVDALRLLTWLPASWTPRGDDWQAYLRLEPSLSRIGNLMGRGDAIRLMPRLVDARGRWKELEERLRSAAGQRDGGLDASLGDVTGVAQAFADAVIAPSAGSGASGLSCLRLAFDAVTGSRNLCSALAISREWHAAIPAMESFLAALPGAGTVVEWDPTLPRERTGDVEFVPLASSGELRAEGANGTDGDGMNGLDHCVGTWTPACARNAARIVSLRRHSAHGPPRRSSTAEVTMADDRTRLVVAQHRGRGNGEPPKGDREALDRYLAEAAAGMDMRYGFGPVVEAIHAGTAGYDTSWPGNVGVVAAWWDRFLAPPYRGLDPGDWAGMLGPRKA